MPKLLDRTLVIVDCSCLFHVGDTDRMMKDFKVSTTKYPTGALYSLFNSTIMKKCYMDGKTTFAFAFDRPCKRKKEDATYKSNRIFNPRLLSQSKFAEFVLRECGYNTFSKDETESDDIITSLCRQYHKYNSVGDGVRFEKIKILGTDRDLAINVDEGSSLICNSKVPDVTKETFQLAFKPDETIPFNCTSFYKVLRGDGSDTIPPLISAREFAEFVEKLYRYRMPMGQFHIPYEWQVHPNYPRSFYNKFGSEADMVEYYLSKLSSPNYTSEQLVERYRKYFKPQKIDGLILNPQPIIDYSKLNYYANMVQFKKLCKLFKLEYNHYVPEEWKSYFQKEVMAINNYENRIQSDLLNNTQEQPQTSINATLDTVQQLDELQLF